MPGDGYKYKYNGKEHEDNFGLNSYEMDLRQYDPAIGRWVVQDPVIHHDYSPYSAFDNNPVYWADPSGADSRGFVDSKGNLVGASFTGQDAIDAYLQLAGESSSEAFEAIIQDMYELSDSDSSISFTGGGGDGNGNGGPGKEKKSESTKSNKQKTEQKFKEVVKMLKASDLAINLHQNSSFFAKSITGNVFFRFGIPFVEISGNIYRLSYSQELKNGYTTTEFVYDTTGTVTGFVIGAEIGGLYGAITGVLIGATLDSTKEAYKAVKPGFMSGYNNFINSAIGNWMKYN